MRLLTVSLVFLLTFCSLANANGDVSTDSKSSQNSKAQTLSTWGTVSIISGATFGVAGLIPIIHGLTWINAPMNYGIPVGEIIVGAGIEIVSAGLIFTGLKMKGKSNSMISIHPNNLGTGLSLCYKFGL